MLSWSWKPRWVADAPNCIEIFLPGKPKFENILSYRPKIICPLQTPATASWVDTVEHTLQPTTSQFQASHFSSLSKVTGRWFCITFSNNHQRGGSSVCWTNRRLQSCALGWWQKRRRGAWSPASRAGQWAGCFTSARSRHSAGRNTGSLSTTLCSWHWCYCDSHSWQGSQTHSSPFHCGRLLEQVFLSLKHFLMYFS